MANTATGSIAEMSDANTKQGNMSNSTPPYNEVKLNPQRVKPMQNVLNRVFPMAKSRIVPILSKNGLLGMKYPASRIIGGRRYRKNVSELSMYEL